jgi:hypothetical protein
MQSSSLVNARAIAAQKVDGWRRGEVEISGIKSGTFEMTAWDRLKNDHRER